MKYQGRVCVKSCIFCASCRETSLTYEVTASQIRLFATGRNSLNLLDGGWRSIMKFPKLSVSYMPVGHCIVKCEIYDNTWEHHAS